MKGSVKFGWRSRLFHSMEAVGAFSEIRYTHIWTPSMGDLHQPGWVTIFLWHGMRRWIQ